MRTVNMLDAKTQLSRLVESIETGAEPEIIIARNGKPAAKLVPLDKERNRGVRIGIAAGKYPSMSLEEFNADEEEIAEMFLSSDL